MVLLYFQLEARANFFSGTTIPVQILFFAFQKKDSYIVQYAMKHWEREILSWTNNMMKITKHRQTHIHKTTY